MLAPGAVPDLVLVNTCTVTKRADQQARQAIRRLAREHPETPIWVTGCYAQRAPAEVAALPGVQAVFGNQEKGRLAHLLSECPEPRVMSREYPADPAPIPGRSRPRPGPRRNYHFFRTSRGRYPGCGRFSLPLDGGGLGWG